MPLSLYGYDKFVAQELSQLTECRAKPVAQEFPDYRDWLGIFVLNTIFCHPLPSGKAALAFAIIRRAVAAIEDYEEARGCLESLAKQRDIDNYFRCLGRFESTLAMVEQSLAFTRKALNVTMFTKDDGSIYQRLNLIYNTGRHDQPEELPNEQLHAIWIKNEGLFIDGNSLTFDELHRLVCEVGSMAGKIAKGQVPPQPAAQTTAP